MKNSSQIEFTTDELESVLTYHFFFLAKKRLLFAAKVEI